MQGCSNFAARLTQSIVGWRTRNNGQRKCLQLRMILGAKKEERRRENVKVSGRRAAYFHTMEVQRKAAELAAMTPGLS